MAAPTISPLGWLALGGVGLLIWRGLRRPTAAAQRVVVTTGPVDLAGASLAIGLNGPLGSELRKRIPGLVFRGTGVSGSTAQLWVQKIDQVLASKPEVVLVSLGSNDAVSLDARAKFPARIRTIVDKIRAAGATPVLLRSPSQIAGMDQVEAGMRATGALVLLPPPMTLPDGIHPTGAGYQQWARAIAGAIA